jgi:cobalt/nickel transport system permease protein
MYLTCHHMHIPDGYLSPSTCASLYAAAMPFWAMALRRLKRNLMSRFVPMVALVAAFSFVVMMFNLPLPGGTTGHATGVAIAAIVVGPWGAVAAISVALLIQALFFGDGGITAFGANSFNIAVVGALVAWVAYRLIAGNVPLTSRLRVVAAAVAGYLAINASALVAAIEFGIQPMLFHDATGAPLYAPYPLHIAVPAMMIGHLTFAGLAEAILSGGVVAYLQRADLRLLCGSAPDAADETAPAAVMRPLWIGVAALMVLTPLGLLAAGRAWGEWSAADFADPAARAQIAAVSNNVLPGNVPAGLAHLSSIWTAPLRGYAPPLLQHAAIGYLLSAMFGVGVVVLATLALRLLATRERSQ